MSSAKRYVVFGLSFLLVAFAITLLAPKSVHAVAAALVQVANTSANPVPAQIVNTPLAVDTSGSTMKISSMPTVQLDTSGGPIAVVDVTKSQTPVIFDCMGFFAVNQIQLSTDGGPMTCAPYNTNGYAVPQGKRLMIEHVAVRVQVPSGQQVALAAMRVVSSGYAYEYYFAPVNSTSIVGDSIYVDQEEMKTFSNGGSSVHVRATRTGFSGTGTAEFIVTGYLVDCPTCY